MKINYLKKFRKKANKRYKLVFAKGNYYIRIKYSGFYPSFIECKNQSLAYMMYNSKIRGYIVDLLMEKRDKYKKYKVIK